MNFKVMTAFAVMVVLIAVSFISLGYEEGYTRAKAEYMSEALKEARESQRCIDGVVYTRHTTFWMDTGKKCKVAP